MSGGIGKETKATVILTPLGIGLRPKLSATALSFAGGPLAFTELEVRVWDGKKVALREVLSADALHAWAAVQVPDLADDVARRMELLTASRAPFAGLAMDRAAVMGVINVTPDSFSDGGDHLDPARAIESGLEMWEAGADILDVGGESTRPGAEPISLQEEMDRVLPVIEGLKAQGARVSLDSRHAKVMRAGAAAGAAILNDVTALEGDPESLQVAAETGFMHMQGEPQTMQKEPSYSDCLSEVFTYLEQRIDACEAAGIPRERIAVDPGIGFGKTIAHNLELLQALGAFQGLGCPLLLGVSRKRFIGRLSRDEQAKQRLPGSLAAALTGRARGAQIFRVHDVPETRQALTLFSVIEGMEPPRRD